MKKRILAMLLCVCLMISLLPISASAYDGFRKSDWSNGWGWWSQNQSRYDAINRYGCYIVAKAKMLVASGIAPDNPAVFNPDVYFQWEINNGQIGYYNNDNDYDLNSQTYSSPSEYAKQCGKTLVYDGVIWGDNKDKVWDNIRTGKFTILRIYCPNSHYVLVNNGASIETGRIRIFQSWSGNYDLPGTRNLDYSISEILTYSLPAHSHSYNSSHKCSCGQFDPNYLSTGSESGLYVVTNSSGAYLRTAPYAAATDGQRYLSSGEKFTVTGSVVNKDNQRWYKVSGYGNAFYIKSSEAGVYVEPFTATIDLRLEKSTMREGENNNLIGTISANRDSYQVIASKAVSPSNDQYTYAEFLGTRSIAIKNTSANIDFTTLKAGTYVFQISASENPEAYGGWIRSNLVALTVSPSTATPKVSVVAVEGGKNVSFSSETSGADIYYTTNGSVPSAASTKYTAPIFVNSTTYFRAVAIKNGTKSSEFTQNVTVNAATAPTIATEYTANGTRVTIQAESGSRIYYSLGGDFHQYTAPVTVTGETEISAFAEKNGFTRSKTVTESAKVAAPECPSISSPINGTKIAQKQPITVSWNKIYNAASYQVNIYKNGEFSESIETEKATVIYVAEEAGSYSFRVQAKNVIGTSNLCAEVSISSMEPVTVSFTDWDNTVIRSQTVDYNTAYEEIQKPTDPERRGYTFLYWGNRYYSNITEDLTIQACYKINTYKVTFLDQNGNKIGVQQTVEFGSSAQKPDVSTLSLSTGYALLGWNVQAEAADSICDFTHVDSNMTVKAVVGWGEPELPVVASITSAQRNDDNSDGNYEITVQLTNHPNAFTTALLRVSLKTAEGKMVKTESRTVGLKAGATKDFSFTVNYSGTATVAEAVVLGYKGDYLTGSSYSEAVTSEISVISDYVYGSWSEWSTEKPSEQENREIETETRYRYKVEKTASSSNSTLEGWEYDSCQRTAWGTEQTSYSNPNNSSYNVWTSTEQYVSSYTHHWVYYNYHSADQTWVSTQYLSSAPYYDEYDLLIQLTNSNGWLNGVQGYRYYHDNGEYGGNTVRGYYYGVFYLREYDSPNYSTRTVWHYQKPVYTYYFHQISDWSAEQLSPVTVGTAVTGGSVCDVESITYYRYRDKNIPQYQPVSGLENTSGEFYTLDGTLPVEGSINLQGKLATVMVYKGKNSDPNESQLQHVGQITIGENNSYSLRFKTKAEPSIETGDFVVCLGVQGSTGLVNVGIISAPKETYTVNYYDFNGNKIGETQIVDEGRDAVAPIPPAVEGYSFVAWSETGRNIHSDMDITAIYVPNTYAVVFVDWQNGTALPYALPHGTDLTDYSELLEPSATGYDFLYWDAIHDGQTTVTGNMVISAVYEPEKYTVNFYDGNDSGKQPVSSQQVAYGESAQLPDTPVYENRVFLAWDTGNPWWDVTGDVDVCAITAYTLTAAEPVSNLGDYAVGMADTLELSAGENAQIYYTTDGTDPIPGENGMLYVAGIPLDSTTEVRAVAVEEGKNNSEVIVVDFYYDEGYDGEVFDDIRTIGTYEPIVKANDTIDLTLNISQNPGLLGSLFFVECDTSIFYLDCVESGGYAYTPGDIASDAMFIVAPYECGWKILFFGSEAITGDGPLFSLKLKVNPDAISGTYPVTVSYSADNMLSADYMEADVSCESIISGTPVRGDINGDGELTLADVVMILRHVVGLDVLSGLAALNAADVNNDGNINVTDALRLARFIAGLESSLR